jgi:DNA polymerase III delta subunit
VGIGKDAQKELLKRVGSDLFRLRNELEKLSSFKGGEEREISWEDVNNLVKMEISNNIFEAVEALAIGSRVRALEALRKNFLEGENPIYIFSMYIYQFRNILIAKDFLEKGRLGEIGRVLRVPPYALEKIKREAQRFSRKNLLKIFEKFQSLDLSLKTGKIEGEEALEVLVIGLTK